MNIPKVRHIVYNGTFQRFVRFKTHLNTTIIKLRTNTYDEIFIKRYEDPKRLKKIYLCRVIARWFKGLKCFDNWDAIVSRPLSFTIELY